MRNVKARNNRMSAYVAGLRDDLGLYQYENDPFGMLRSNEKDSTKAWWHNTPTRPADPLRRPAHKYFWDRTEDVASSRFAESSSGSGTVLTIQDRRGGWAKFTNGAGNNEYYFYEAVNEIAALVDGQHVWFDTEIEITDVDEADLFVGLCSTLGSGNLFDNRVDCVGFTLADGSGALQYVATKDSTGSPAATGETLSDGSSVRLSFIITGLTRVDFYVDDVHVAGVEANLPDDEEMGFSFGLRNGQAVANAMSITTTTVLLD